jgi:hypothetical protein
MPRFGTWHRSSLLFGAALLVLYAGIMVAKFALWRANVLMNDWAFYNTSFWNTNFRDLWLFDHDRYIQYGYPTYLNEHFAPLLLLLAVVYQWVPKPEAMLLLMHGASPVLAAIFIHATALHLLGDRKLSLTLSLSYAFNPGILWPTICLVYGFQTDCLLPPCAAAVGWALATNRTGVYFLAFALALCLKENVPAYGVILGACLLMFTQRRGQALITILMSLIAFVIASKGVPAVTGVENRNVAVAWRFIDSLLHLHPTFDYTLPEVVIGVGYSLAFLPALFVWPFLGVIVPDLLLIGQVSYAKTVTWHVMLPVTVLGVASVYGTARILATDAWPAWLDRRIARPRLMQLFSTAVLAVSLIAGPLTIWLSYDRYIALRSPVDQSAIARALALIPADAGVATTSDIEQYFTRRLVVSSRLDVLRKAGGDFSYFVVNRRSLTEGRRDGPLAEVYRQDVCLIDAAEGIARAGGKMLMDSGGVVVVQFAQMPTLECH